MTSISATFQIVICALPIALAGLSWSNREQVLALVSATTAQDSGATRQPRESSATPVILEQAQTARDDLIFCAIGTGFARRSVSLRGPSNGTITELKIAPGRKFDTGDMLLRLDDQDQRLTLELAQARFERAASERTRFQQLQTGGVAATARFEEAQTAFAVARIELEQARAALSDSALLAPFAGVSDLSAVEVGDRISQTDSASSFDDRSSILVEFDLPEALLSRVRIGLPVTATTPAIAERGYDGEVTEIDSRVDAVSRTVVIRAAIDNSADLLRPGASFSVRLDLPGPTYVSVPELAPQFADCSLHVWRVRAKSAERVEVRMVRRRAGSVILDGDLMAGDDIVVEGTQRLRPGLEVDILNPSPEPRA